MPLKQYFFNLPRGADIEVGGWGFMHNYTQIVYHRCGPRKGKRACWKRGVRGGPWFCRACEKQLPDEVYMLTELQKLKPKIAEDEYGWPGLLGSYSSTTVMSAKEMANSFDTAIKEATKNAHSKSK